MTAQARAGRRASTTVEISRPLVITISGAITAARAASGAYLRPRLSHCGKGTSRSGIRKKARVNSVMAARPTQASQGHSQDRSIRAFPFPWFARAGRLRPAAAGHGARRGLYRAGESPGLAPLFQAPAGRAGAAAAFPPAGLRPRLRSEERRVGKE